MKVLVCEDDKNIREGLALILRNEGYITLEAGSGKEAALLYRRSRPDFVCLDIMLPDESGLDVCRTIRKLDDQVPIMFITAKSSEPDRVLGLELGADDYVVKPFGVREVVSRIRAITRRCGSIQHRELADAFQFGDLKVVPQELYCFRGQQRFEISLREAKILRLLFDAGSRIVTREKLFDVCWDMNYLPQSRTLDQQISKLRKKIGQSAELPYPIETIHGIGYRYNTRASG